MTMILFCPSRPDLIYRRVLILIATKVLLSSPSASASPLNVTDFYSSLPYKPYSSSQSFLRSSQHSKASRPVNSNVDAVVSCGSCCFDDPIPIGQSGFLDSTSPYQADLLEGNFYEKIISANGVPIVSSAAVSDAALLETALILVKMASKNPHLLTLLEQETVHFAVIGRDELLTDIPSYSVLGSSWNYARGVGATRWIPTSSCAEEDLLCLPGDSYSDESICVHEHSHTLQGSGGKLSSSRMINFGEDGILNLDTVLREIHDESVGSGLLWSNTYAASNHEEMWAEAVQSYYNVNRQGPQGGDGVHNNVWSRNLLEAYHLELHDVIEQVFPSDVDFSCPTTSLANCDCTLFRQICEQAGITIPADPTLAPTPPPTPQPTPQPTIQPTPLPTPPPTPQPTPQPTLQPTPQPTPLPTPQPNPQPTPQPTPPPTPQPTPASTPPPTPGPIPFSLPTSAPSKSPTASPALSDISITQPPSTEEEGEPASSANGSSVLRCGMLIAAGFFLLQ